MISGDSPIGTMPASYEQHLVSVADEGKRLTGQHMVPCLLSEDQEWPEGLYERWWRMQLEVAGFENSRISRRSNLLLLINNY
jgi:hypothetical protein